MSHTPGPWIWNKDYKGLYGAGKQNAVLEYFAYEGMSLNGADAVQTRANANLIAAAPDILAALKELIEAKKRADEIDAIGPAMSFRDWDAACAACDARLELAWAAAQTAIAKAEP